MTELLPLRDISTWHKMLGLLPVPLFGRSSEEQFVLLNGSQGNFCLDVRATGQPDFATVRNLAWSANVGHYITILGDTVDVQRWDQYSSSSERYSARSVSSNLEKFHRYLESNSPTQDLSIIAYSIKMFRRLRAVLGEGVQGGDSLKGFLYFLSCAVTGKSRGEIDLSSWCLTSDTLQIVNQITTSNWDALIEDFLQGRPVERLSPNVSLILRHAAGQLFQEAHYEATYVNPQQLLLTGFLPSPVKPSRTINNAVGIHFTPPALARTLVEESLRLVDPSKQELIIFDPACGSGEFLREALRQLNLNGYIGKVSIIGWDISDTACAMARFELGWEARYVSINVIIDIQCKDSLNGGNTWPRDVDVLLMNPPFVSWQEMSPAQKNSVKEILGDVAGAKPDLSHAFLQIAGRTLPQNGIIGSIIPASVLDGISSSKLRNQLGDQFSPSLIARLGSHQLFPGALVDAAFYIGRKGDGIDTPLAFWADYRIKSNSAGLRALRKVRHYFPSQSLPIVGEGFSIYESQPSNWSEAWTPRPYKSWKLINSLKGRTVVKDLFNIRQGIRTGNKKVFVINKTEWLDLPDKERKYFRQCVVNDSIRFGYLKDNAFVFFPYGMDKIIKNEEHLQSQLEYYYHKYLLPNIDKLKERARINQDRWWELSLYRTWSLNNQAKIVSTYFGDSGSFALDDHGKYVVVDGSAWLPKSERKGVIQTQKALSAYLSILNSKVFSQLLAATSSHVGGGQWDLSKQYLDSIPIPNFWDPLFNAELISELSSIGRTIKNGLPINEETREELVYQAYQLLPE